MKGSFKILIVTAAASIGLASTLMSVNANPNHDQKPSASREMNQKQMGQNLMHGMMNNNMMPMMQMMQMMHQMHSAKGNMMDSLKENRLSRFDADGNGTLTPEELSNGFLAEFKQFDSDGDKTLSIAEFETMHSARIRTKMVDRFQELDDDGDGKVTEAEILAHADRVKKRMQRNASSMQMNQMHSLEPDKQ